jgi:chromosome segregation ATPase
LSIIKGTVSAKTTEKTVRFVQKAAVVAPHQVVEDAAEDDAEEEDDDVSFLQAESPRHKLSALATSMKGSRGFMKAATPRDRLVELLTSKGKELKSTVLSTLATKVAADPFAKIKKLVQELIERLLQEAADEANHKGWCDKELTNAKQQRTYKSDAVKMLNAQLESAEAKRDKLAEEIATLTTEIVELTDSLSTTTEQRAAESAQNAATVSEAEEGEAAVSQALDVLDHFYKTAAKATVFVQRKITHKGVEDDLPDTGFGGANTGSQGAATGILGMLEVIKSDFARTIKETEKAEKEAETEFIEFERTTKVSISTKTTTKTANQAEKAATVTEISDALTDMREEQSLLDKALQELEELRPACIDTGMSYEERVARREQEIEALNEALCILDSEGAVQTEPSCA